MADAVDGLADLRDPARDAGRGLVVNDGNGLEGVVFVCRKALLDGLGAGAMAPVAGDELDLDTPLLSQVSPERGEMAGLVHQDLVARGKCVDNRCFPSAGARGRVDDDRALGLENR